MENEQQQNTEIIDPNRTLEDSISDSITLSEMSLKPDQGVNDALHRMGRDFAQTGMDYCGTIQIHLYITGAGRMMTGEPGIQAITNITTVKPLAANAVNLALRQVTPVIERYFKPGNRK
jgi:hypothetical protein